MLTQAEREHIRRAEEQSRALSVPSGGVEGDEYPCPSEAHFRARMAARPHPTRVELGERLREVLNAEPPLDLPPLTEDEMFQRDPRLPVAVDTAYGSPPASVEGLNLGEEDIT